MINYVVASEGWELTIELPQPIHVEAWIPPRCWDGAAWKGEWVERTADAW